MSERIFGEVIRQEGIVITPPPKKPGKKFMPTFDKAAYWKRTDRLAQSFEPRFKTAAAKALEYDRRHILALLSKALPAAYERKATIDWRKVVTDVKAYLENVGADNWRELFVPLVEAVVTAQGANLSAQFGIQFNVQNLGAREWFDKYTLVFAQQVNQTTNDTLSAILEEAQARGSSIPDIQDQIEATFDKWIENHDPTDPDWEWFTDRMPAYRTEMIARTETIRSSNAGSQEIYTDWGVERKEWLSTPDDRTRSYDRGDEFDHVECDGQVVDVDKPFIVSGEELMYPGDPAGSPGNTIQCRCTVLPVLADTEPRERAPEKPDEE